VTGIRFDGVKASMLGPLPSQLELQPGEVLTDSKVRESLRRLYETGLYETIQVQGLRSEGGVVVVFAGRPRLFLGRTQIFGIKSERLLAQLAGSTRLQAGTRYTQRKLDASQASVEQALTDNGFYEAKVERREQLDAPNSQVNIIYNIDPGRQAKVGNVKVDGTPGMSLEQFRKTSKLKAGSKVNRQSVNRALTRLRKYYDKRKRWAGSVTLEGKEYHANTNQLDYTFRAREGPLVRVQVDGAKYGRGAIERLVPIYEEGTVDLDLVNEGAHNLQHHLWWHCALFELEHGDHAAVLELYDTRFRNLAAPLTVASPDVYIDVQNAASILFRLQRLGVDVGNRWEELADKAEARIGDCQSAFTLPHWLMALTATGRTTAAERMIEAMRAFANGRGTVPRIVRDYALPIAEAQLAHAAGRHSEAVALMRPAIGGMYRLGGSHAQQDVLEQFFLDAAVKADSADDVRLLLARVKRHPVPPHSRVGYAQAAKVYLH